MTIAIALTAPGRCCRLTRIPPTDLAHEGNQFFNSYATDTPETFQYTIILITKTDFVFADQDVVFYETRSK
jgi:hypothetical protein